MDNETICAMAASGQGKLLLGTYYYEGKLVTDLRGIKKDAGVHVVWTDNINMASFVTRLSQGLEELNLSSVLFDTLMGYDIGGLLKSLINMDVVSLTVEQLIVNILFGASRSKLVDYGNGHSVLQIPCDLGLIVSIIPLVQGLIPENIIGLVKTCLVSILANSAHLRAWRCIWKRTFRTANSTASTATSTPTSTLTELKACKTNTACSNPKSDSISDTQKRNLQVLPISTWLLFSRAVTKQYADCRRRYHHRDSL